MLHIRNTLHKQISRKLYTFKTSNLDHCVLRVMLHLNHLPLQQEAAVYTPNRGVPKITVWRSSFFLSDPVGKTRYHVNFMLHYLYQSVALLTGHGSDTSVLSTTQKLSKRKFTRTYLSARTHMNSR